MNAFVKTPTGDAVTKPPSDAVTRPPSDAVTPASDAVTLTGEAATPTGDAVAPPRRRRPIGRTLLVLALLLGAGYAAHDLLQPNAPPQTAMLPPPPAVTVSAPLRRKLASWTTFTGQFSAVDRVEIRSQVSGYLTAIDFKDGQLVKKGDLLFVIDQRPYQIALANAQAQVETADSTLDLAKKELVRTSSLVQSSYASRETFDQRTQQQNAASAALDQAKAVLSNAQLNMDWTRIVAPISGRISTHRVSVGNLIVGGQGGGATTLLTTVVSEDPVNLDFDMGEGDYIAYQRYLHRASDGRGVDHTVDIALSDEGGWPHKGRLDFIDNEMDRSSGTLHARATVPNADLLIAPGQFARLRVPTGGEAETTLVPDAALSMDQSRTVAMTVAPDGTVVPKVVETGPIVGDLRVIKGGLATTDRVIINGLMFAHPGTKVSPKPGTIPDVPNQS